MQKWLWNWAAGRNWKNYKEYYRKILDHLDNWSLKVPLVRIRMEVKNMVEKKLYCLSENQKWTLGRNTSDEGASGVGSEGNEVHVFGNVDEKESLLHNCKKFS